MQDNAKKSDATHHSAQLLRDMFSCLNQAMSRETEKFHQEQKRVKRRLTVAQGLPTTESLFDFYILTALKFARFMRS